MQMQSDYQSYYFGDEPSVVERNGTKIWYKHGGQLGRNGDLPAIVEPGPQGRKTWYKSGYIHRDGGMPAIVVPGILQEWWINGKRHRVDGPAVANIYGLYEWWINGKRHRIGGPAVINKNKPDEWWENGVRMKETERKEKNTRRRVSLAHSLSSHRKTPSGAVIPRLPGDVIGHISQMDTPYKVKPWSTKKGGGRKRTVKQRRTKKQNRCAKRKTVKKRTKKQKRV